jgi:hypothetical protein
MIAQLRQSLSLLSCLRTLRSGSTNTILQLLCRRIQHQTSSADGLCERLVILASRCSHQADTSKQLTASDETKQGERVTAQDSR